MGIRKPEGGQYVEHVKSSSMSFVLHRKLSATARFFLPIGRVSRCNVCKDRH